MGFELYPPAPLPPKPAQTSAAKAKYRALAAGAPHVLGLRWSMREDGTVWAWRTRGWRDLYRGDCITRMLAVGLRQIGHAEVFFDTSKDPTVAEAVVKQLQSEDRAFAKAASTRVPSPPPPLPEPIVATQGEDEIPNVLTED
jgi:hypothetical protein